MRHSAFPAGVAICTLLLMPASAQPVADGESLLRQPSVRAALDAARQGEPATLDVQVRLCEIPAPPFKESARAQAYADALRAAGLGNVRIDAHGNVLATRPGRAPRPHLVMSAHLDTVFPAGTDVRVTRAGRFLKGPGIGDNCRGLAVLLGIVRALNAAAVQTEGTVTFVATVGEEGVGDLRGVKGLFADTLKGQIDRFIAVDGAGHAITNVAVGSRRYRVTFSGAGGHSFERFGVANPVHALGRAIAALSSLDVPADPRTTFNVGRIGGGTSVNAIPADAWMEIDLRSSDPRALIALADRVERHIQQALADENARWKQNGRLMLQIERIGERPAGHVDPASPLVQGAAALTRALGLPVRLREGSTDANVPVDLGIPAIAVGAGGSGTGSHSLEESFDTADSWRGTQRLVLFAVGLTR